MAAELRRFTSKRNRTRSPSYPYLDLATAALEKRGGRSGRPRAGTRWRSTWRCSTGATRRRAARGIRAWRRSRNSGLAEHEGMGENAPGSAVTAGVDDPARQRPRVARPRRDALRTAALATRASTPNYGSATATELPSEPSLKRFLVLERSFNEASVDELVEEYQAEHGLRGPGGRGRSGAASRCRHRRPSARGRVRAAAAVRARCRRLPRCPPHPRRPPSSPLHGSHPADMNPDRRQEPPVPAVQDAPPRVPVTSGDGMERRSRPPCPFPRLCRPPRPVVPPPRSPNSNSQRQRRHRCANPAFSETTTAAEKRRKIPTLARWPEEDLGVPGALHAFRLRAGAAGRSLVDGPPGTARAAGQ